MAKNIEINYNNGLGYDVLYPYTTLSNITDWSDSIYSKDEVYSKTQVDTLFNNLDVGGLKATTFTRTGTGVNEYTFVFSDLSKIYLLVIGDDDNSGGVPSSASLDSSLNLSGRLTRHGNFSVYFWKEATSWTDSASSYVYYSSTKYGQMFIYYSGSTVHVELTVITGDVTDGSLTCNATGYTYRILLIGE